MCKRHGSAFTLCNGRCAVPLTAAQQQLKHTRKNTGALRHTRASLNTYQQVGQQRRGDDRHDGTSCSHHYTEPHLAAGYVRHQVAGATARHAADQRDASGQAGRQAPLPENR